MAELLLRALSPPRHYPWRPGLVHRFRPAPGAMEGVSGDSELRVNSLGLRGDEPPPGADRVVVLGGSAAECLYLDQAEAWPGLLQERLGERVWVGNAGRSGLDSRHHRLQARILLDELANVRALVVLAGANDLLRRLARGASWRRADPDSAEERRELLAEAFQVLPGDGWHLSALADRVRRQLGRGRPVQDDAGRVYVAWRAHRAGATERLDRLPDLRDALAEYGANLRAIVAAARRRGARVVLVTQPALWRAGLPPDLERRLWMGGAVRDYQRRPGHPYYSSAALRRGLDAYDAELLAACSGNPGAACFDLGAAMGADGRYLYDDVHLNEAGSRRAAELLAPAVAAALRDPGAGP